MATIVVGGHSRNVGKTSVTAAIIAAWPQYSWTAVKISSHWHEGGDSTGKSGSPEICRIDEEFQRNDGTDTGRFLAAGASRSFWVRVRDGNLQEALPQLMPVLHSNPYAIIESNGIVRYIHPDLYLMVHRYDVQDYKKSARENLRHVDAVVAVNYRNTPPAWKGAPLSLIADIPIFRVTDPQTLPQDLMEFIQSRLD